MSICGTTDPLYLDYTPRADLSVLSAGAHVIEINHKGMTPKKPVIYRISGKKLIYAASVGANKHIIEYRTDSKAFAEITEEEIFTLRQKVILRIKGVNDTLESEYSNEYPYFPSQQPPEPPDGLHVYNGRAKWGEVYGATGYKLYKDGISEPIYFGTDRSATAESDGVYHVTAINEYGESKPSFPFDCSNPIINFYPSTYGEPFSRLHAYLEKPYYLGPLPDLTYPE